ncbi:NAD(P)-binding protein [Jackrogersella minutella]|nr:NAD(P)-binding protein [Jackrogersella minutella]
MSKVPVAEIFPVLKGKVAIVTGAARGMGKATAELFLKAGAKVVICDIREQDGQEVAAELSKLGDVLFVKTDISKSADVQNLIEKTVAHFGRLDAAVNNAAMAPDKKPFVEFDEEYWNKLIGVNLTGTALCCKYEMQQMIKQGGKGTIVNIASVNAFRPQPTMPAYTAAKHSLIGLTKHAATEGGAHGIRINAIAPGAIYSEMSAGALAVMGVTEEEFTRRTSVLNRFGMAHEVAQGSLWLSSDASSFLLKTAHGQASTPRVHEGKLAIVTGSARSIGAAIARNLAGKGCNIVVNHATSASDATAAQLCSSLSSAHGVRAVWERADVSKRTGAFQIDILVHNAGIVTLGPLESAAEEDFDRIYAVNVLGPLLLTGVGTPNTSLYSGTKGAVEAMTRVWCRELAERATVNSINPGPVMTDMYMSSAEEVKRSLALWNPLTPLAKVRPTDDPEVRVLGERIGGRGAYDHEIAGLVGVLCSPEAGWCTGSLVSANGGLSFSM